MGRFYGGREVYHPALIDYLGSWDGWALSTASGSLRELLPLCPPDVRVGAWVKPYAQFKPTVRPQYAWEPVIFHGGRHWKDRAGLTARDWLTAMPVRPTAGVMGQKPEPFSWWVFRLLGAQPGDEFCDLFPGSGAVTRAWRRFEAQAELFGFTPREADPWAQGLLPLAPGANVGGHEG
jgi:hypothetical protein